MLLTLNLEQLEIQNGRHPVSVWAERCGGQGSNGAEQAPSLKSPGGNRRLNTFFKKGDSFRTWKEVEKKSINTLQADIKIRLASLHRGENLQKQRRKKEQTRTWFYKDPFKLLKTLFTKEKSRVLKTTKNNLEEHLRRTDSDPKCWKPLTITSDISPIHPTQNITLTLAHPTWKEVEKRVHRTTTASAPGPYGVSYKVYKNIRDVIGFSGAS